MYFLFGFSVERVMLLEVYGHAISFVLALLGLKDNKDTLSELISH